MKILIFCWKELLSSDQEKTTARNVAKTNAVNTVNAAGDRSNLIKYVSFKNNAPFINCISKINRTLIDNAEDLDVAGTQKKIHSWGTTTLIISNEKMNNMMEIVQVLEDSNILLKGVTKTIKNKTKKQEGGFQGTLVGTLGSILLGNLLSGKEIVRAGSGKGIVRAGSGNKKGNGIVRVGYGKEWDF